jgi:O-antigen/teichoic acid export membrane protein
LAQGLSDFGLYNGARVLWPFIHLVAMALFWAFGVFTAQIAALCYVGAGVMAIVWTVWRFQRHHRARLKAKMQNLKDYLSYALKTYGLEVLGLLSNQIDKIFILGVLSLRELGIYSVAFGLSRVLGLLQNSIASVIFPAMVNLPVKEVVYSVARAARIAIALNLLGGLPLLLFGGFILKWVFGHEFAEGSLVLQLLVLEVIISGTAWVLAQAFNAVGRPGLVVFRQTVGIVVAVIALTFLAPRYGAEGVAFALMLGGIVRVVLTLASFPLALNVSVPSLMLTKADLQFAYHKLTKR